MSTTQKISIDTYRKNITIFGQFIGLDLDDYKQPQDAYSKTGIAMRNFLDDSKEDTLFGIAARLIPGDTKQAVLNRFKGKEEWNADDLDKATKLNSIIEDYKNSKLCYDYIHSKDATLFPTPTAHSGFNELYHTLTADLPICRSQLHKGNKAKYIKILINSAIKVIKGDVVIKTHSGETIIKAGDIKSQKIVFYLRQDTIYHCFRSNPAYTGCEDILTVTIDDSLVNILTSSNSKRLTMPYTASPYLVAHPDTDDDNYIIHFDWMFKLPIPKEYMNITIPKELIPESMIHVLGAWAEWLYFQFFDSIREITLPEIHPMTKEPFNNKVAVQPPDIISLLLSTSIYSNIKKITKFYERMSEASTQELNIALKSLSVVNKQK